MSAIIAANPGINPIALNIGQIICIPGQAQPGYPGQSYTVRPGDTLGAIAQRFGVTVQQILNVNPQITNPNVLVVGQVICIPTGPAQQQDCAIVLTLSQAAVPAFPAIAGGVVLIQRTEEGNFALTFAASGLPSPETIGNFNAYIGSINIRGQFSSTILNRSGAVPTWAST